MDHAPTAGRQDENEAGASSAFSDAWHVANVNRYGVEQWKKQQRLERRIEEEQKEYTAALELQLAKKCTQCGADYKGGTRLMKHRRWGSILLPRQQCNTCERGFCEQCYPRMIIQCDWCTSDNTICCSCQTNIVSHKKFTNCTFCGYFKCPIDITGGNNGETLCCLVCRPSIPHIY